ncbi:MAG: hypothetical protein RLZZ200_3047 [Pseudomonadota bacterium]|jgi:hypothetical protein
MDRRYFLGGVTLTVSGLAAGAGLSPSLLAAAEASWVCTAKDPCGDWQLDDICNSYPPYAFRVDAAPFRNARSFVVAQSADWHWAA